MLPQASGELRDVKVRANVVFPFKEGLKGLRLEADTLSGRYMVAGLDTQTFSAPVKMIGGKIAIPSLTLRSKGGAVVNGRFELDPATKRMNGNLSGNSLAAQLGAGDKIKLRDFKLELRGDSTTINLQVDIGSGSAEHVKAPMRAAGDFSRVSVIYRAPLGKNTVVILPPTEINIIDIKPDKQPKQVSLNIPEKYRRPESSGLAREVKPGNNVFDFELKD